MLSSYALYVLCFLKEVSNDLQNRNFFTLSPEAKVNMAHPGGPIPQRGWSRLGAENSAKLHRSGVNGGKEGKAADKQEGASIDLEDSREHFDQGMGTDAKFPNRWPREEDLPGFRGFMEKHYDRCNFISVALLESIELSLGLEKGRLSTQCVGGASEMRLNHYPPISVGQMKQGSVSRIWPHTDLGVLTLLFQDTVGGLEIEDRTRKGSFFPVPRGEWNELIVNVSETLERWTNGVLPAGVHQVTVPPSLKDQDDATIPARFSNAFFVKADREADVGALEHFVKAGEEPRYKSMTAHEYHTSRVASAY